MSRANGREFLERQPEWSVKERYEHNNGLTVLVRRERAARATSHSQVRASAPSAKLAVVTLSAGDDFERLAALVNPPKARFCDRWGYDFVEFHGTLDSHRPVPWSKIRAVQRVLPNYEWVVWCDADTVLWNAEDDLQRFVDEADGAAVVLQNNQDGVNTGLFFIRNCSWSFDFLDEVYRQEQCIHHPWWEQAAVNALLVRDDVQSRFGIYPPGQPIRGFHGYYANGDWDKTFIHFAGLRDPERLRLIENLVRLAEYPQRLRLLSRNNLGALLNCLALLGEGVEVGVAGGDYSKIILDTWQGRRLHLVDIWRYLPNYRDIANLPDERQELLLRKLPGKLAAHAGRYQVHRLLSEQAAEQFANESLDFVYLDADHSYEAVSRELRIWYAKLRPGGLFAGHDFLDGALAEGDFGVRRAVAEFERASGLRAAVTTERDWPSWYLIKP